MRQIRIAKYRVPRESDALETYLEPMILVRLAVVGDAAAIAEIYNHYVLQTVVTFEEEAVSVEEMERRIAEVGRKYPWLVAVDRKHGTVLGYAYASDWKSRCAYRNSVETTVYLKDGMGGRGLGKKLYTDLLLRLQFQGLHTAIGGIALPNAASVALHEKCGFVKVGEFKEVGNKFGQWIAVGYWQRMLQEVGQE